MSSQEQGRPYVICHIFSTIDGRIDGAYMFDPAAVPSRSAYGRMQAEFGADALVYGSVTAKGFAGGPFRTPAVIDGTAENPEDTPEDIPTVSDGDHVTVRIESEDESGNPTGAAPSSYCVSIDPHGEVGWQTGTLRRAGKPDAHVIEVVCENGTQAYRAYLREHGVSYVVAGRDHIDLALALKKLRGLFSIERVLVCGGGVTDGAFLAAGLIDELSIVVAPLASGERGVATIFDESDVAPGRLRAFALERAERLDGDGLHLVYRAR